MSFAWFAAENKPQSWVFRQLISSVVLGVFLSAVTFVCQNQMLPFSLHQSRQLPLEPGAVLASVTELDPAGEPCAIKELSRFI